MTLRTALALALLSASASAQSGTGGFTEGDLYLHTVAWTGISSDDGAVVKVDPQTGTTTVLHDLVTSAPTQQGICHDPWRDRLLFFGGFVGNSIELWASDASGNLQSLGLQTSSGGSRGLLTPRGDGIVYMLSPFNTNALSYMDAQDQVHELMDSSGTAPWSFGLFENNIQNLLYVPSSNSLLITRWSFSDPCAGIPNDVTAIHRLDLSPDGTQVLSESCYWYDGVPNDWDGETRGLCLGPDGDPILVIGNGNGGTGPQGRVARIQMSTDTASAYAFTDFFAQQRIVAGTYSHALGKAIVQDSFADVLRAYGPGEVGDGAVIATLPSISGTNERAYLIEIPPGSPKKLTASPATISVAAGGTQSLQLDLGAGQAGNLYLLLGSFAGTAPGVPLGSLTLPLVPDFWFDYTLTYPNLPPLVNTVALLDGSGQGSAAIQLGPLSPTLTGSVVHHAAVILDALFAVTDVTNAESLEFVP